MSDQYNLAYPNYDDETTQEEWYQYFHDRDVDKLVEELEHGLEYFQYFDTEDPRQGNLFYE